MPLKHLVKIPTKILVDILYWVADATLILKRRLMINNQIDNNELVKEKELADPIVSDNALTVLKDRYLAKDDKGNICETPKQMYLRVASAVASAETTPTLKKEWTKKFYNLMARNVFLPNSPTLMNAGRRLGMLSACFVLPVEDDLDRIFDSVKATALVQRAGGGTGFNFSNLRPSGSIVKSSGGTTAGPLSFIDVFSQATNTIQQGAFRRGANMGIMNIDHPDVIDFIKAKYNLKRWQNYNISIAVTSKFMDAVSNTPLMHHKVHHKEWGTGGLYKNDATGDIVALQDNKATPSGFTKWTVGDTWKLICTRAWETGEPGLFFIEEANRNNPVAHLGNIEATNPCITGDTKILTINGPISIKDLVDGNCTSCNGTGYHGEDRRGNNIDCSNCNATGRKDKKHVQLFAWDPESKLPVIRNGYCPRLTGYNSEIIEIEFDSGLKVRCTKNHNFRTFRGDKIEAQALTVGQSVRAFSVSKHRDGHLRAHGWVANKTAHQWVHRMVWETANGEIPEGYVIHHIDNNPSNNELENLELLSAYDHQSEHYKDRKANGFGREGWKTPEVEVNKKISNTLSTKNHKVIAIKDAGHENVYNITVGDVHTYIIVDPEYKGEGENGVWSGIVSCNCGEQPLHAYDSCNLGSINLSKLLDIDTSTGKYYFNFDKFNEVIHDAVRFLDNIVSINKYPLKQIEEMSHKTRRIGLGVMGFADTLMALGIKYGSKESLDLARRISLVLNETSYQASELLAREKGCYGAWKGSHHEKIGVKMRNAFRTTIAPTGTISIIANCSSGIEPIFALSFKRTVMPDANNVFKEMWETNKWFLKALDVLQEIYPDQKSTADRLMELAKKTGSIGSYHCMGGDRSVLVGQLQNIFITSHEVQPKDHVEMQAAWQKYIDTAISKTINLPHDAEVKDVMESYWLAYLINCKGITVYRDGCRNNVEGMKQPMSIDSNEPNEASKTDLQKNDPGLERSVVDVKANNDSGNPNGSTNIYNARRTRVKTQFGNLHVFLVFNGDGKAKEVFAQLGKAGDFTAADVEAICRLSSILLARGCSVEELIEQLEGIGSSNIYMSSSGKITSIPQAIAVGIRELIQTDVKEVKVNKQDKANTMYGVKCPQCSVGTVVFEEGCEKCHSCGHSAC